MITILQIRGHETDHEDQPGHLVELDELVLQLRLQCGKLRKWQRLWDWQWYGQDAG